MSSYGKFNYPRDYENEDLEARENRYSNNDCNTATCTTKDCVQRQNEQSLNSQGSCNLPKKFEQPHFFHGYGCQDTKQHPFYKTTSSDYGWYAPDQKQEETIKPGQCDANAQKRGRCFYCDHKNDSKQSKKCSRCNKFICKTHSKLEFICVGCHK